MNIEIVELKPELALVYKEHVNMDNIVQVMDKGLNGTYAYLKELGKNPTNAPFCRYTNGTEDYTEFDLELGFPIAEEVPAKDGMYIMKTDGGKAVSAMHKGAYSTLETTYNVMMEYVQEKSLEMTGVYYDWYLNDPDSTSEEELLTKVVFLLK